MENHAIDISNLPADINGDQFVCPICGPAIHHARPWQMRANSLFVRRPINPRESNNVIAAVNRCGLPENIASHIISLVRPDALQKFEAIARIYEMHESGDLSLSSMQSITRAFDS